MAAASLRRLPRRRARCAALAAGMPLLLLLGPALAGCEARRDEADSERIVFAHFRTGGLEVLRELLDRFEEETGIEVVQEILPAGGDEQHRYYVTNLDAGGAPPFDVFAIDVIWVPEMARAGWLHDLAAEGLTLDGYVPGAVEACSWSSPPGGPLKVHAVPWYVDAGTLYYRADLLKAHGFLPPRTYRELAAQAEAILEAERAAGRRMYGLVFQGRQYEGLVCAALEMLWGNGADLLSPDGRRAAIDEPEALEALRFLRGLLEGGAAPGLVLNADEESTRHLFQAGRAVFMRNWTYAHALLDAPGSPVQGRFGVMPVPPLREGVGPQPALGGWQLAVPARSPNRAAAARLVAYLVSEEVQAVLLRETGLKPALRSLYEEPERHPDLPWLEDLAPPVLAARPRPLTPYYLMISEAIQPELSAVLAGIRSPERAARTAARQIDRILALEDEAAQAAAAGAEGTPAEGARR